MEKERDLQIWEEVYRRLAHRLKTEWSKEMDHELSGTPFLILDKLDNYGAMKVNQLAEALHITPGGITGLMDKLIEGGYAVRHRAEDDRRGVYLDLTDKGKEAVVWMREKRRSFINRLFEGVPPEDIRHLIRIYSAILDNVNRMREE